MRRPEVDVDHFRARVITDAFAEADRRYWERRAQAFEDARPRRTDYHGQATPRQIVERYRRLTEVAAACRHRATVSPYASDAGDLVLRLEGVA